MVERFDARSSGVLTVVDQNGERLEYKSDRQQATALAALENEIRSIEGRKSRHTIHFRTSKGI
jgi:hypothetical protein